MFAKAVLADGTYLEGTVEAVNAEAAGREMVIFLESLRSDADTPDLAAAREAYAQRVQVETLKSVLVSATREELAEMALRSSPETEQVLLHVIKQHTLARLHELPELSREDLAVMAVASRGQPDEVVVLMALMYAVLQRMEATTPG